MQIYTKALSEWLNQFYENVRNLQQLKNSWTSFMNMLQNVETFNNWDIDLLQIWVKNIDL